MKLFYTSYSSYLANRISLAKGKITRKQFSDGEWYIRIDEDVADKPVFVVAATPAPGDTLIELLLLLDALSHEKARIHLFLTYFGYARQDHPNKGQAHAAQLIGGILERLALEKVWVVHAHSTRLHDFFKFDDYIPYDMFADLAQRSDVLVAPDAGALAVVMRIAAKVGLPVVTVQKQRLEQEEVKIIAINGQVRGKRVLIIDDMIATGSTIIKVAHLLHEQGAQEINVAATHGIFSNHAYENIEHSSIKALYVTNSLKPILVAQKIIYIDLLSDIEKIIKTIHRE